MKRNPLLWQLAGFAAVSLCGTLLHFMYEWTGESIIAALFSGVNESTWEHMKLLFFPLFAFDLVQSIAFGKNKNFWCIKFIGIASGLILIPVIFYTYNGAFGTSPDFINIAIFFISAAAAFLIEYCIFKKGTLTCRYPALSFAAICLIGVMFIVFTFKTPEIPIFKDPVTGTYGI